tara:strand:- start:1190 stop:2131 length:942 start_codon:yes stop_codon:yes gene_type:complete
MKGASGENIGGQLGKTGTVKLTELNTKDSGQSEEAGGVDGYRRNYDDGNDYLRVNPFAVQQGTAPDPDSNTAPFNLLEWNGYSQWDDALARGTNFDITSRTDTTMTFAFTKPTGYSRDTNSLNQRLYFDTCTECDDDDDPRSGGSNNDGPADNTSFTLTSLSANTEYIFCIVTQHNQDGTGTGGTIQEGELYEAKASLTLAGSPSDGGGAITIIEDPSEGGQYLTGKTLRACTKASNVGLGSSSAEEGDTCGAVGSSDVWSRLPLATGVTIYQNDTCGSVVSSNYVAFGESGVYTRTVSSGVIQSSPNTECLL